MPHAAEKRREAGVVPLILFGDHGRTVEGYRPANEDLTGARAGGMRGRRWAAVEGPHLRTARLKFKGASSTGIVGISLARLPCKGNRLFYTVNLGRSNRRFCVETLGKSEALRRAIALRREHLTKLALANAVILAARAANQEAAR
jgi:hypothetical protein